MRLSKHCVNVPYAEMHCVVNISLFRALNAVAIWFSRLANSFAMV